MPRYRSGIPQVGLKQTEAKRYFADKQQANKNNKPNREKGKSNDGKK